MSLFGNIYTYDFETLIASNEAYGAIMSGIIWGVYNDRV